MSESFQKISELSMRERYDQFKTLEYLTFLVSLLKVFHTRKYQKSKEIHWSIDSGTSKKIKAQSSRLSHTVKNISANMKI